MNSKIPLRVLAQQMAMSSGLSENDCLEFVKALFQNVSDELYCGNKIIVDGVGTFSIDTSKLEPVMFDVDPELAAELNAPFSFFQPITLSDSLEQDDIKKLQDIDTEAEVTTNETIESADVEDIEKDTTKSEVEDAVIVEELQIEENQNEELTTSDVTLDEDIPAVPQIDDLSASSETVAIDVPSDSDQSEDAQNELNDEISLEPYLPEPDTAISVTEQICIPEEEEEHVEYYPQRRSSRFWIGFIVGLLTGLILAAVAIAFYAVQILNYPLSDIN